MAFRFSLATVLGFRESIERREELALQKITLEIARTRLRIEELTAEITLAQESLDKAMRDPMTAFQLQIFMLGVDAVVARKKSLVDSLVPLEKQRELQLNAYQAAHRSRQILSEMADRQRAAYDLDRARAQQKFLDDLFASRAHRK